MLEKLTHIEGLDAHEDHELFDDTDPTSVKVRFDVKSEEMPFRTAAEGRTIRQNFVVITKEWELGRSKLTRRIRDKVEFDEATNKWVIKKLANDSDVRKYPNEWNHFYRGNTGQIIGTPLSVLFKADPSKVEHYKSNHFETVEQLAAVNESNIQDMGMGARDDVMKAKSFMKKSKEAAGSNELLMKLEEKDRQIASMQGQLTDLMEKLDQVLRKDVAELSAAKKGGRGKVQPAA